MGALLLMQACASSDPGLPVIPSGEAQPAFTRATADQHWSQRADSVHARQALHLYRQLAMGDSTNLELWARLARAYYFNATYWCHDPAQRDSLYMRGHESAQTILYQNESFRQILFATGEEKLAIRGLDARHLDAIYWGIANYGRWLATKGKLVRLGQLPQVLNALEYINEVDSAYYYGAYGRYLGALICRDPAGDLDQARAAFEQSLETHPEYLGTYTLMARFYARQTSDKDLFYQLLTTVLTTNPDPQLPFAPENQLERIQAEHLMIQAERENWFTSGPAPGGN